METVPSDVTPLDVDPERRAAAFRALRETGGVVPFPGLDGVLAAVSYDAVDTGLRSVHHFGGSAGQDNLPDDDKFIAALSEPRHGKVRRVINSVVAIHRSQQIEPYLGDLSARLVDRMLVESRRAGPDGVDLVAHLAEPIPPSAMARLFGFPEEDALAYYGWIRESGRKFQEAGSSGRSVSIADSSEGLAAYVDARIDERLAQPQDEWPADALTRFLVTEVDGERLTPRNIKAQIMFMIGAGSETTRNTIGNLFYRLGRDPEAYAALRRDPSLVDAAIEETLRIDPPAQWMVRTCGRPIEIEGRRVEPGQKVFMCIGSANRDDDVHEQPNDFRLERTQRDHLAFGSGPHVCPGASLARMEIRAAVRTFLERVESYHLVEPERYDAMPTAMLQGPRTLRIVVDAEVARDGAA
jgi:cytochrome P450